MAQPRRRKAGYLQQLRFVVVAVAAWRCQDLFPLYGHVMVARVGGGWAGHFRRGRRNRERCIRVHGRGECRGAAFGHGGSIDALDDARNAHVHGTRRLHRSGFRIIAR